MSRNYHFYTFNFLFLLVLKGPVQVQDSVKWTVPLLLLLDPISLADVKGRYELKNSPSQN